MKKYAVVMQDKDESVYTVIFRAAGDAEAVRHMNTTFRPSPGARVLSLITVPTRDGKEERV